MPIGVIINSLSVFAGGIIGTWVGGRLSAEFKEKINLVFGACSMAMGISSIVLMVNMPAVIFSIIIGTILGLLVHLGKRIDNAAVLMQKGINRFAKSSCPNVPEDEFTAALVTIIVLFCASGTGIYGAIVSGMAGDHSILISKSMLDLFTAIIFACTLGTVVSVIAIPQFVIFLLLFFMAGFIFPMTTPDMISDFKACGGIIMVATGFRMIKVKMFPIADMIPSMILVMPFSALWTTYIFPFVR